MKDKTKKEHECRESVYGDFVSRRCLNKAKVKVGGRWYCHVHDPKKVKERTAKRHKKWDADSAAREKAYDRRELEDEFCAGVGDSFLAPQQAEKSNGKGKTTTTPKTEPTAQKCCENPKPIAVEGRGWVCRNCGTKLTGD